MMKNENFIALQKKLISFSVFKLIKWANVKYALLEISHDQVLKDRFNNNTVRKFWSELYVDHESSQYKELATIALLILSIFPTTVYCERSFSVMHFIKNKYRNQLTDVNLQLEAAMRLALEENC